MIVRFRFAALGMALLCLAGAPAAAPLFETEALPCSPEAHVGLAQADLSEDGEVMVLHGHSLRLYGLGDGNDRLEVTLPEGVSAFDLVSLPAQLETGPSIVAVRGADIIAAPLDGIAGELEWHALFSMPNRLSNLQAKPYPYVLSILYEDIQVLALPGPDAFELRTPGGEVLQRYATGDEAPKRVELGRPFIWWTHPEDLAAHGSGAGMVEGVVNHIVAYEPTLPADVVPIATEGRIYRQTSASRAAIAAGGPASAWPWFPLRTGDTGGARVLYAHEVSDTPRTVVRLRLPEEADAGDTASYWVGPRRVYTGALLAGEGLPDVNGDGFHDLALWYAPSPGRSVSALAKAMTQGDWPVEVRFHTYNESLRRFHPRASAVIPMRVPLAWFVEQPAGAPLRHVVARDFDADGDTDFACALDERRWGIWRYEAGYSTAPDQVVETEAAITSIAFVRELQPGRVTVGLRTEGRLWLLAPPATAID